MRGVIGRVYKIHSQRTRVIYVGITFNTMENEWEHIIQNYNNRRRVKYSRFELLGIYPFFKIYGIDSFNIELLAEYKVCDLLQLHAYGQLWINRLNVNCCNELVFFNPHTHMTYTRTRFYKNMCKIKYKSFKKVIRRLYYRMLCTYTP